MTAFEKLALRGLWLILKQVMRNGSSALDQEDIAWVREVSKATANESLRPRNFGNGIRP